jgi:hypothetical protein
MILFDADLFQLTNEYIDFTVRQWKQEDNVN